MPYYDQYGPDFDMGGGNAARDYARYKESDDFSRSPPGNPFAALGRLFGRNQPNYGPGSVQSQPLPPPPGVTQTGGPFGGPVNPPEPPAPKPTTQLASNNDIMRRISKLVQSGDFSSLLPERTQDFEPDWGLPRYTAASNYSPFDVLNMGPPPPMPRINMRGGNDASLQPPYRHAAWPTPAAIFSLFRANGGQIPGYMRGGYPELFTRPIRHTFDSGGENYVGPAYGNSGGRSDDVNARLSPREYVMDAETMALLGDGNPDEGAKKMDELRVNIRKHKGKKLAKGEISPDAKPASAYIAGSPLSDGIRRAGRTKK